MSTVTMFCTVPMPHFKGEAVRSRLDIKPIVVGSFCPAKSYDFLAVFCRFVHYPAEIFFFYFKVYTGDLTLTEQFKF